MRKHLSGLAVATALTIGALVSVAKGETPTPDAVVIHYGETARSMYEDAHSAAVDLGKAVDALIAKPSSETLEVARRAWKDARPWYQQTEGFRFGNAIVDDWEGRVNAWPLDEGLIDYVDGSAYGDSSDENPQYVANVIANTSIRIGNDTIDATKVDAGLLGKLHEAGGVESNVATGYHAIEFLLWGQDLNGTEAGAGNRPATDFDPANCTGGNCERRAAYLKAATDLLIADLQEMAANWQPDGEAGKQLKEKGPEGGLSTILAGLGSLSYGELAGERMKLGLILHDPEEEHDCFSDNTHDSHYHDQTGMTAIWRGEYKRRDGSVLKGASLADYAKSKSEKSAVELGRLMDTAEAKLKAIKDKADSGQMAYDQMIGEGNAEGNKMVQEAIDALVAQARGIEAVVADLGLQITVEGSDSLDNPSAVGAQ